MKMLFKSRSNRFAGFTFVSVAIVFGFSHDENKWLFVVTMLVAAVVTLLRELNEKRA